MLILRVSMSSSIDSGLTCVGTRSRQTSIHDPSPQPVSQERGAGEPVGLHHGPSLRRRRGGGEKKNKHPAMELSPPPLGISEAAAAPPAVRSLQLQFPAWMLRLPPLPPVPRCAVPRGVWSRPLPRRRSQAGLGRCPTGSPCWQPLRNVKKKSLLPLGERAAATKWCLSGPELQWRDGRVRIQAGPARGRVLVPREGGSGWWGLGSRRGAGQGAAAGASALTRTPTRAHSQLLLLLLLLQKAGGGWCIKGEAPPNRVSSPRTLPQQRRWPRLRLRLLSAAVGRTQPRTGTCAASS